MQDYASYGRPVLLADNLTAHSYNRPSDLLTRKTVDFLPGFAGATVILCLPELVRARQWVWGIPGIKRWRYAQRHRLLLSSPQRPGIDRDRGDSCSKRLRNCPHFIMMVVD